MGFRYFVDEKDRLPQLNSVYLPAKIKDEAALRNTLLTKHNLEIGGGLGALSGKIWRIGLMGYTARPETVDYCLKTLGKTM